MRGEVFDELRRRVSVRDGRLLLRTIGFPAHLIPDSTDVTGFWLDVRERLEAGARPEGTPGVDGEVQLIAALVREYPGNEVFRRAGAAAGAAVGDRPAATGPLRVLFLHADPAGPDRPRIRVSPEARLIQDVSETRGRRTIDLDLRPAARPEDLISSILRHRPDLLHLGGHGSPNGYFMLERDDGTVAPVHLTALATVLKAVRGVSTLVLTACYLGRGVEALLPYVSAVVSCEAPIADPTVLSFDRGFYTGLLHGEQPEQAYRLGLAQTTLDRLDGSLLQLHHGHRGTVRERS